MYSEKYFSEQNEYFATLEYVKCVYRFCKPI